MANIDLNLDNYKYLDLIKQAETKVNFVNNLGEKRIRKITIVNEGDSIKVSSRDEFINTFGERLTIF